MIYRQFQEEKLSLLGFGAMRLPLVSEEPGSPVDEEKAMEMVDCAISQGINYFDTAYPYHKGASERIVGKALKKYPRETFYLADKFPGHQIADSYDPAAIFEEQLKKCGVDYFDFYLLHNINERSIGTYLDPRWGIIDYFLQQRKEGRIRHLGFSTHGNLRLIEEFLELYGKQMEFCQIQVNYLDWSLQDAKAKYDLLTKQNIPVWVMEPVRGGRLSNLTEEELAPLRELRPQESSTGWAFRFLQDLPKVDMILTGASTLEQLKENVEIFKEEHPLTDKERERLFAVAEGMKNSVPCTACRYCCEGCPLGLDIPTLLMEYNDARFAPGIGVSMRMEALPEEKRPSACIGCGKCSKVCPQNIDIPEAVKDLAAIVERLPKWADVCRQRAAEQER